MGVRIASGLCPSPARHNLNVAGAVNLSWGFKLSVILSMIGASPVESDHHGAGNASFPPFKAFSTFLQLLQLWLRANRRWRRPPIRSTVVPAKKALNVISIPSRSRADPPLPRSGHLGRRAFVFQYRKPAAAVQRPEPQRTCGICVRKDAAFPARRALPNAPQPAEHASSFRQPLLEPLVRPIANVIEKILDGVGVLAFRALAGRAGFKAV